MSVQKQLARVLTAGIVAILIGAGPAAGQVAVRARTLHTMGPAGAISDGVIVCRDGKIVAVGPAASTSIPEGFRVISAQVAAPGLIDAHCTIGLSGIFNQRHDSDQLESSSAIQPELRALDAYNPQEPLVAFVRSLGVTTINTGHAPGELISGQTIIVKTVGNTVGEALVREPGAICATIGPDATRPGGNPGTRGKGMSMLREQLLKAREHLDRLERWENQKDQPAKAGDGPVDEDAGATGGPGGTGDAKASRGGPPDRNLRLETLGRLLKGEVPLLVTVQRAQDIDSALRLAEEFKIRIWLDGAAEGFLLIDRIKASGAPVIIHPPMMRAYGLMENASFETAAKLVAAGVPVALQAGYEAYVPKTRVVLFEAAVLAANGLTFQQALATITIDAAKILGVSDRVGSLEVGKDGDIALYDGDPFEYTSHCVATVIGGQVVFEGKR